MVVCKPRKHTGANRGSSAMYSACLSTKILLEFCMVQLTCNTACCKVDDHYVLLRNDAEISVAEVN